MTIQKLFCKIVPWVCVLIPGLIPITELSANPRFEYTVNDLSEAVSAPQERGGEFKLTGQVFDETKAGVPGATVTVKGSTRGVITGNDGSFTLEVTPTDVIVISYLGFETQEIPVGARKNIVVELVRKTSELEAVTVVAYGKQRKESIVGAINTLDAKELKVSTGQLSSSLAGKLAGLVVMQRTGEPGSSAEFWIRGVNTFGTGSTTPLVLVDGIERSMDLVDADDIATFSILKDATATAVYGVRGANGIILITTKRGMEGTPKINVKAEFGMTQPTKLPKMANTRQWLDFYDELCRDSPTGEQGFSDYERQMYLSGKDPDLYPSVDWTKEIFKNLAMTGRVNVSVAGGSPKVRYYVGVESMV